MPEFSRRSIFVLLPFFLWGTAMVAMKGILPHTTPMFVAAVRLVPAGLLLVGLAAALGRPQPRGWQAWSWIGLFALTDATLFQGCLAAGLERTGAGLGSLLIDSQPLAVAVLAALLYKERLRPAAIAGLAIGLAGIGFIGLPPQILAAIGQGDILTALREGVFTLGEWLMLGASLSMAVGTILIRPVVRYADPVAATGWHMVLGGLPLLVFSAGFESGQLGLSMGEWLAMAYATIFGSAIAYGSFFYFASTGSLTTLSALTFSTPVFALMFSRLLLGETLRLPQWVGVALTLLSIYLVTAQPEAPTATAPPAIPPGTETPFAPPADGTILPPTDRVLAADVLAGE